MNSKNMSLTYIRANTVFIIIIIFSMVTEKIVHLLFAGHFSFVFILLFCTFSNCIFLIIL